MLKDNIFLPHFSLKSVLVMQDSTATDLGDCIGTNFTRGKVGKVSQEWLDCHNH